MGTSKSSPGSPSGVPLVPPWVPDIPNPDDETTNGNDTDDQEQNIPDETPLPKPPEPEVSPPARWRATRLSLGRFARSGDTRDMKSGVGRYVKGLGGPRSGTRRLGSTIKTAGTLYGVLSGLANKDPESQLDSSLLEGRTAREIIDIIIETVQPIIGTMDAEASRISINDALSDVMERFPEADLCNLSAEQREFAIERFVANDLFHRLNLDVGNAIKDKAKSITTAISRLREIKEYIRETVAASFRKLRETGSKLIASSINRVVKNTIQDTLEVFAEYT